MQNFSRIHLPQRMQPSIRNDLVALSNCRHGKHSIMQKPQSKQLIIRLINQGFESISVMLAFVKCFSTAWRRYSWERLWVQSESSFCCKVFCDCKSILTSRCSRSSCLWRLNQLPTINEANRTSWTIMERLICRFSRHDLEYVGVMVWRRKCSCRRRGP